MPESPAPHQVYSEELSRAFKRGHPLAEPHASIKNGRLVRPITIGDVGYIQSVNSIQTHSRDPLLIENRSPAIGDFVCLFNIHLQPGVDGQPDYEGLPGGTDFRPVPLRDVRKVPNKTAIWASKCVTHKSLNVGASGYVVLSHVYAAADYRL